MKIFYIWEETGKKALPAELKTSRAKTISMQDYKNYEVGSINLHTLSQKTTKATYLKKGFFIFISETGTEMGWRTG